MGKKQRSKSTNAEEPEETQQGAGELPEELEKALQEIPEEAREKVLQAFLEISIQKFSSFSGPLPPPTLLKEYSDIVENGAERIFQMTEKQSNHRMQLENHALREELDQSRRGQNFGFTLGLVGLILATVMAILDHEVVAGIFGTTTIVGLVTVFVIGKRAQIRED